MDSKPLHEKLFTDNNEIDEIALHIAGATVRHRNPFEAIEVPRNGQDDLDDAFIEKYVVPFYSISISTDNHDLLQQFASTSREVTADIVAKMLGEFDWRPRIVGAFFAAIMIIKNLMTFSADIWSKVKYATLAADIALPWPYLGRRRQKKFLSPTSTIICSDKTCGSTRWMRFAHLSTWTPWQPASLKTGGLPSWLIGQPSTSTHPANSLLKSWQQWPE